MNEMELFVYENGFVNPEKVEAVKIFGFEKAKKMWENGGPNYKLLNDLRILACLNYELGIL